MNAKQLRTAMQEEMESGKRFAEVHNADPACPVHGDGK